MRISHFFIDRPIFASVVSIVFVILGGVGFSRLPVAQYPEIAPPTITVNGTYPGASSDVVAATVVAPIEQQINGVENMIYMTSNSTSDGSFSISVTFDIGTDLDTAQVQVQNRVSVALPRLPADVRAIGVTVDKRSPDIMMVVHLYSPDKSRDTLFMSNYATLEITDAISRIDGVGSIIVFGSRDYAMRVWLDPDRLQSVGLTASDVVVALQGQNVQVASGVLNQPPVDKPRAFQISVRTQGRLKTAAEFSNIVVKQTADAVVRLKDVATVELAAQDYTTNSYLDLDPAIALGIFQRPGSNALSTADKIKETMETLSQRFPPGMKYTIVYNPTQFIQQSVDAVEQTIGEAIILVILVVILFLQTWRAAVIPIVAIPVSLIGTFFVMSMFGFSLNNLSLFGLVLAIGIVVDDAIVVVENVERNIEAGLSPHDASVKSMDEVGGALIAIALVLSSVFIPSAFITGISGQFYRQFALTIAGATIISLVVSLTLSPALCALLLKPHKSEEKDRWWEVPIHGFFRIFNRGFAALTRGYGWLSGKLVRIAVLMLVVYAVIIGFGLNEFRKTPSRFHSGCRPWLSDHRHPTAAGRFACPHRRSQPARGGDRAQSTGHRPCGEYRGLLGGHVYASAEFGRDFRHARSVREAGKGSPPICRRHRRPTVRAPVRDSGRRHFRGCSAAGLRHRQCRRFPHDDRGPRRAWFGGLAGRGLRHDGRRRQNARRLPVCSRCSRPRRHRSISISTAPRRSCSASAFRRCSRRCRSISARPMSTTSTCSGVRIGWSRRPRAITARTRRTF